METKKFLRMQGKKPAWSSSACYPLHAGILLGLFFDPEDVCDVLLPETSVELQRTTRRYIPEDRTLHNHRCENIKSYMKITLFWDVTLCWLVDISTFRTKLLSPSLG
jgi:hypothetical protein